MENKGKIDNAALRLSTSGKEAITGTLAKCIYNYQQEEPKYRYICLLVNENSGQTSSKKLCAPTHIPVQLPNEYYSNPKSVCKERFHIAKCPISPDVVLITFQTQIAYHAEPQQTPPIWWDRSKRIGHELMLDRRHTIPEWQRRFGFVSESYSSFLFFPAIEIAATSFNMRIGALGS